MKYEVNSKGIATLWFKNTSSKVNSWNSETIDQFAEAVEKFKKDNKAKGLILTSADNPMCAGADLKELMPYSDIKKNIKMVSKLANNFRKLETCGKPVVAAITGTVLGGGFELVLGCHHRIVLNNPKIQLGLPEVQLGLLPGAGGTQRLPRLIGIEPASSFLLEGTRVKPKQALEKGLVDDMAENNDELIDKATKWIEANPEASQPWDHKKFKIPGGPVLSPKNYNLFTAGNAVLTNKTFNNYPAPQAIMACLYEGLQLDIDSGLKVELRYFEHLLGTAQATHLTRTMFFGLNKLNGGYARPKDFPKTEFKKVGILGAGMMGAGIAYATARSGIEVVLKDVTQEAVDKGKAYTEKVLGKRVAKGRMKQEELDAILARIHPTTEAKSLSGVDLLIEAVPENREIKEKVFKEAEEFIGKDIVVASNTSTLPITGLAEYYRDQEKFIGLHFFSPVDKMPLVEIIRGKATSDETLAKSLDFVMALRKTPIVVNDGRGFFTSRVFTMYVSEGMNLLKEGVAPALIENAARMAGMPVGPLAVADEVSLDLIFHIIKQTEADLGKKSDLAAAEVSDLFVNKLKRLGRKSAGGLYEYPKGGKKKLWSELANHFPVSKTQPTAEIVGKRLLYVQALDAARAFEDNVVTNPLEGDIGSILGIGFPPFTGGAFSYMDWVGIDKLVSECEELAGKYGSAFEVPQLLKTMAKEGKTFY